MQEEYQLLLLRKDWRFLHSISGATATATASVTAEGLSIKGNEKYEDVKHFIK